MKAVILARVSTKDQEEGHSIQAQTDRLRAYCGLKGLEIIREFVIVESSTRGDRPEFHKMLDFIKEQKECIALVCDKVDRLQRNFNDVPTLEALRKAGKLVLHFHVERQVLDANANSSQIMMWQLFVMMSENYTNCISDNVKRSIEKKLKEGTICGCAPVGYLNAQREDGKTTVVLDPFRAPFVKKIFEEYATGMYAINDMVIMAKSWGLINKRKGGKPVGTTQMHQLLQNPFYYGAMSHKGILYPHCYEPLISKQLFDKCQAVRTGKKKDNYMQNQTNPFIFRGIVKCKKCGRKYSSELKKSKYVYLRPNPLEGCDCQPIKETDVLQAVEDILNKMRVSDSLLSEMMESLKATQAAKVDFNTTQIATLQKQHGDIQRKLDTLLDLRLENSITKEEYDRKYTALRAEQENVKTRIDRVDTADDTYMITMEYLIDLASRAADVFKSSGIEQKRKIINCVFSNLEVEDKNVVFSMRKPFDKLMGLASCQVWRE